MTKCSRTVVAQNDYFYVTPGLSVKNFPPDARTGSASTRRSQGQRRLTGGFRQIFRRMIAAQRDPQREKRTGGLYLFFNSETPLRRQRKASVFFGDKTISFHA